MKSYTHRSTAMNARGVVFRNNQASSVAEALQRGLFRQVRELLNKGADPNEAVAGGKNALMVCTMIHDPVWTESIVRQLLECGGTLDQKDNDGNTAFHYAIIHNRLDVIDVFFDAVDFDLNIRNNWGFTPLHYAVDCYEKLEILTKLLIKMKKLNYSIDINNRFNCSPLVEALRHLNFKAVEVLITFGARTDLKLGNVTFREFYETLEKQCSRYPHYLLKIKMSIALNQNEDVKRHDSAVLIIRSQNIAMAPEFDVRNNSKCVKERPNSVVSFKFFKQDTDMINSWKRSMPNLFEKLVDQSTVSYRKGLSIESILLKNAANREGELSDQCGKGNRGFGRGKNGGKSKLMKRGTGNQEKMSKKKQK